MSGLFSYEDKKVVLTGGTTGVGAAAVELLAQAGCTDLTMFGMCLPRRASHLCQLDCHPSGKRERQRKR